MTTPSDIAVVHIALKSYGIEPLHAFLGSYRTHPAGMPHDLIVALKGFDGDADAAPFRDALRDVECQILVVPDGGFDIGTYFHVADRIDRSFYCFLNTRARILGDDWLAHLHTQASRPGVGIAGATASNESLYTDHLRAKALDPAPRFDPRRLIRHSFVNDIRWRLRSAPFPNPHLRTNAFVIGRETFLRLRIRPTTRADTAAFENGRGNVTRRLARMGLDVVLVGRDGRGFAPHEWASSDTFWQGAQANLLIADNQTDLYDRSDPAGRVELSNRAWNA